MRNYLVTGGVGFVGAHLVEELVKQKAHVIVVDNNHNPDSYFFSKNLQNKVKLIHADIRSLEKIKKIIKDEKIDTIFHLAAQAIVDSAYENPAETLEINIMGTVNILEAARLTKTVKAVIIASSDKAYGKLDKLGQLDQLPQKYVESDPLCGDHPYEVSKSCTDLVSLSYFKTYGLPVAVTRFGNIYGEGDLNFSRIIPGIMEAIIKNKTLDIRSNGKYVRDYLYVKDVVSGYLLLAKHIKKAQGEAFNFGSNDTHSVLSLIDLISQICLPCRQAGHIKIKYKIKNTAKNEIPYQSLDFSKIKKLGWKPKYNLKNTIKDIYKWYSAR